MTRLLLVTAPDTDMESLASVLALGEILKSLGKTVTLVTPGMATWPEPLRPTLPAQPGIQALRALHIRVPVQKTALEQFSYDIRDQQLHIELLPKEGAWPQEDVAIESGAIRYDGLIAINVATAAALKDLVTSEPEWLAALPTFHLSSHPETEPWATQTESVLQGGGLCEEFYTWVKERGDIPLSNDLVHHLLVGLIAATDGFRHPRVQSRTLQTASELIERGADRQAIMNRLWRIRSVPTLNVWGRGFMRLSLHPSLPIATTIITEHDFLQAQTTPDSLPGFGKALLDRLPETRLVLVFSSWNKSHQVQALTRAPLRADLIARWFNGQGSTDQAHWSVTADDLLAAQKQVLDVLDRELPRLFATR